MKRLARYGSQLDERLIIGVEKEDYGTVIRDEIGSWIAKMYSVEGLKHFESIYLGSILPQADWSRLHDKEHFDAYYEMYRMYGMVYPSIKDRKMCRMLICIGRDDMHDRESAKDINVAYDANFSVIGMSDVRYVMGEVGIPEVRLGVELS